MQAVQQLKTSIPTTRWGQERRLEFIEFRLQWEGRINRAELVRHFSISVPQASTDLARYAEMAPQNLVYDKKAKTYVRGEDFAPVLAPLDPQRYLTQLWNLEAGVDSPQQAFLGWRPPCELAKMPTRNIDSRILAALLASMRGGRQVHIDYQSLSQPVGGQRWIQPHALAHDGSRWHVRAWCGKHQDFRDFVLSRIRSARAGELGTVDFGRDARWHEIVVMQIVPRADLSLSQRRAVEHEYGMTRGVLAMTTRAAMLHYVIRHLQLDRPSTDPNSPPLVWKNRSTLAHHLLPNM